MAMWHDIPESAFPVGFARLLRMAASCALLLALLLALGAAALSAHTLDGRW